MRYRMLRDVRYSTVLHGNDSRLKSQDNFREKAGSFSYTSENKKSNNSQSAPILKRNSFYAGLFGEAGLFPTGSNRLIQTASVPKSAT